MKLGIMTPAKIESPPRVAVRHTNKMIDTVINNPDVRPLVQSLIETATSDTQYQTFLDIMEEAKTHEVFSVMPGFCLNILEIMATLRNKRDKVRLGSPGFNQFVEVAKALRVNFDLLYIITKSQDANSAHLLIQEAMAKWAPEADPEHDTEQDPSNVEP